MARTTKLTPEVQKSICDGIALGDTWEVAAIRAGITERTVHNWRKRGKKADHGIYFQFIQSLKKAEADANHTATLYIRRAMATNWTAAAWWLERRDSENYGRPRYEVTGNRGGPIEHSYDGKVEVDGDIHIDGAIFNEAIKHLAEEGFVRVGSSEPDSEMDQVHTA